MEFIVCPKCKIRVLPKADGTCPSCQAVIGEPIKSKPAIKLAAELPPMTSSEQNGELSPQPPRRVAKARSEPIRARKREVNYKELFFQALKIAWTQRVLWIPALLMSFFMLVYLSSIFLWTTTLQNFESGTFPPNGWVVVLAMFLTPVIAGCCQSIATIMCSLGTFAIDQKKETLKWRGLFPASLKFFWRLIGLQILISFLIGLFFIPFLCLLAIYGVNIEQMQGMLLVFISLLLFLIQLIVTGFVQQATAALIVDEESTKDAISRGWKILFENLGTNLLIALTVTLPYMLGIYGLNTGLSSLALALITGLNDHQWPAGTIALYIVLALIGSVIYVSVQSYALLYYQSAWTLTFLRLTRPAPAKRLNA